MSIRMMGERIVDVISNPSTWPILIVLVVIFLVSDGIITNLPFYDLQTQQSFGVRLLFGTEVLVCSLSQIFYLKIIKRKYSPTIGYFRRYAELTHSIVSATQYIIIALLLITFLEIETLGQYHTVIILISILLSLFLSVGISSLLAFRFFIWIRYKVDYLIIAYTAAAILITINSIFVAVFMSLEVQGKPMVIDSSWFWANTEITRYDIHQIQSNVLLASFVSLWIASFFLLRQQRTKWRALKFYTIVSIPLLYYLGLIQLAVSNVLVQHGILSIFQSYTFNVINSILSKPVGGALFGIAFWMVARSTKDKNISDYMKLSAFGIMLLSISNVDAGLYLLPYPPFGLPTITFVGISSYMLLVGIYFTSISVSMNTELRKSIEKSVDQEFKFISKIGRSQVDHEIQSKVKAITKRSAKILEENSGIKTSLEEQNIDEYIKLVIKEKQKMSTGNVHTTKDNKDNSEVSSQ